MEKIHTKKEPLISIIVPVYNVEKYLGRCIDSILNQTIKNIEVILVNDGSTDSSGMLCDKYKEKDDRIKIIHKSNGGLSDARNFGIRNASGKYIGFVDSDDYIKEDMYENLYNACEKFNVKLSVCGRIDVYDTKFSERFILSNQEKWGSKKAIENLLKWNNIDSAAWDKLFHKDLLRDIEFPIGKYNEDIFIMSKIIHNAKEIVHIGEAKYYYCHRRNSITSEAFGKKKMDLLEATEEVRLLVKKEYPDLLAQADSFHNRGIVFLLMLLQGGNNKKDFKEEYSKLKSMLSNNILEILKSDYIEVKIKIISILIYLNVFQIIKNIKDYFN